MHLLNGLSAAHSLGRMEHASSIATRPTQLGSDSHIRPAPGYGTKHGCQTQSAWT